jgi:hypothetical protein
MENFKINIQNEIDRIYRSFQENHSLIYNDLVYEKMLSLFKQIISAEINGIYRSFQENHSLVYNGLVYEKMLSLFKQIISAEMMSGQTNESNLFSKKEITYLKSYSIYSHEILHKKQSKHVFFNENQINIFKKLNEEAITEATHYILTDFTINNSDTNFAHDYEYIKEYLYDYLDFSYIKRYGNFYREKMYILMVERLKYDIVSIRQEKSLIPWTKNEIDEFIKQNKTKIHIKINEILEDEEYYEETVNNFKNLHCYTDDSIDDWLYETIDNDFMIR